MIDSSLMTKFRNSIRSVADCLVKYKADNERLLGIEVDYKRLRRGLGMKRLPK